MRYNYKKPVIKKKNLKIVNFQRNTKIKTFLKIFKNINSDDDNYPKKKLNFSKNIIIPIIFMFHKIRKFFKFRLFKAPLFSTN